MSSIERNKKTFAISWYYQVLPTNAFQSVFTLKSVNREIQIRRIFIGLQILDNVGKRVPYETGTDDIMNFTLNYSTAQICECFTDVLIFTPTSLGVQMKFFEPGMYEINGFKIKNEVVFFMYVLNMAAVAHTYDINIVVTTRENINYQ